MIHLYFGEKRPALLLLLFSLFCTLALQAQINSTPFEQVFITANLNKENLKKDFPHLYQVVKNKDYKTEDVNAFIKGHEAEWKSFTNQAEVKKLNIAWGTLGLNIPETQKVFSHPLYQWYKAAGITEAKKAELFPHFPLPNLKNEESKELQDYEQRVGIWQRTYPEEYEHFLNAPELTALNPYYKGYYKLPYIPRFVGAAITFDKPEKEKTGNAIMDEYHYQLKLRNWYFVFKPAQFEKLYGSDYKFPATFDAAAYRNIVITKLNEKKGGPVNPADNH